MKRDVFIAADNIYSPVGSTTAENFSQISSGIAGVKEHADKKISAKPFHASLFDKEKDISGQPGAQKNFTRFENLLLLSIAEAFNQSAIKNPDERTILIISSTKGNISLLETSGDPFSKAQTISLTSSAEKIATHFQFTTKPLVISNACISGLLALITAKRLLESGAFDTAVVAGADEISSFIFSGFQSFQALSDEICKPFDISRKGINLGEGAATIILSTDKKYTGNIRLSGGAVRNDANHISGPSRTGVELFLAIQKAMKEAGLGADEIDFISAHGTATIYNDEMEAKAISLANLQDVPVNSLKGYFGHTLGAAGLIETIITKQTMLESLVIPTPGYLESGVSEKINVCSQLTTIPIRNSLKTASGFGGCNAAITLSH